MFWSISWKGIVLGLTTISCVMPIHNEEKYLPYSLSTLKSSPINELIVILDRCSDNSEKIVLSFSKTVNYPIRIVKKHDQKWRCPTAENYQLGFSMAKYDLIFSLAGDCVYDPKIFSSQHFVYADLVSFLYWNFNLFDTFHLHEWYENFLKSYLNVTHLWEGEIGKRSGMFGIKNSVWRLLEFRDVPSEYDDLMKRCLKKGFSYKFVDEHRNFHLRAGLSRGRQELQGMSRAQNLSRYPPWKVLAHSIIHFKPYVFTSYLREKNHHVYETRKWSKKGLT